MDVIKPLTWYSEHRIRTNESWPAIWFYGALFADRVMFHVCLFIVKVLILVASKLPDHGKAVEDS